MRAQSTPKLPRRALVQGVAMLAGATLCGCRSMGLTPWKITQETTDANGKRVEKTYEIDDWDDFTKTLAALGDDFSADAARVKALTGKLVSELTELPPPGHITLRDVGAGLARYEGKERFDFVAGGAKRGGDAYDFKYVRLGVKAFDDFFRNAARTYAVAYQKKECDTRRRALSEKVLGRKIEGPLDAAVREALSQGEKGEPVDYLSALQEMAGPLDTASAEAAVAATDLARSGAQLAREAPRAIKNPKVLLHIDEVVMAVKASVGLIEDSATLLSGRDGRPA